jgi:hypothetical protein
VRFVVLDAPGRPRVVAGVPEGHVRAAWAFALARVFAGGPGLRR